MDNHSAQGLNEPFPYVFSCNKLNCVKGPLFFFALLFFYYVLIFFKFNSDIVYLGLGEAEKDSGTKRPTGGKSRIKVNCNRTRFSIYHYAI